MKTYLKFLCLLPLLAIFIVSLEKESKAWTFEDFLDYVQFTYDNNINSSNTTINNYRNWIVSHKQDLYTQLQNLNINVDNYNNFIIYNGYASHRVEIYMYYGTPTYTCSNSGVYINPTISCLDFHWATAGNNAQYDTKSTPNGSRDYLGLIDSNPTNGDYYNTKIQNVWNYYVLRNGVYTVDNLPWELADVKIAYAYNQENIIFTLYDINDNEVKTLSYARQNEQSLGGYLYLLYIDNTIGLIDGQTYYFKANNGSDILRSENFILNWTGGSSIISSGTITNQSGDVTGSVDLSGIENRIDLTNQTIVEQTQAILSGDKNLRDAIISGDNQIISALTNTNFSGDLSLENLPTIEIEDPSNEFFTWLMTNIQTTILYSGDSTLVIPIYDEEYEIRSDVFKLNVEPLKTFISIGWWFICGVPLLKWVRHIIETVRSGNIPQVDDKSDLLGNVL